MGRIKQLDETTIGLIAAGEVVERPASVVKELLENALDAGATRVDVEIKNGGRSLIRVSDNGAGMDRDDLALSIERHATSKIDSADDLTSLVTLGFRGEALPSIAAVSNLEISSRPRGQESGYVMEMKGPAIKRLIESGMAEGTTVKVTDLFGNVPARLKYMKSIPTEAGYIADVVGRLAIAYPEVSFRLIHHEYEILFTPGSGDRLEAITAVFGREVAREMLPLAAANGEIKVSGFLGKPSIARTTRNYELTFLNGRFIKSRITGAAIEKAFRSLLPITRYPLAVVFLEVSPAEVDINVHPAKLEAKFADDNLIFRAVYQSARRTLTEASLLFSWREEEEGSPGLAATGQAETARSPRPAPVSESGAAPSPLVQESLFKHDPTAVRGGRERFLALGLAVNATYILARDEEGFLLVDQHAAHERVLFERYLKHKDRELIPQRLLLPVTINLTFQQARLLAERQSLLEDLGFGLEPFGPNTFLLRSMPASLSRLDGPRIVFDLLDELSSQASRDLESARHSAMATMSCHAAIKAGDVISTAEMQALLDDLSHCELPYTCPHGRPTAIKLSWEEIARRFRRR